jgi:hypothetical protein
MTNKIFCYGNKYNMGVKNAEFYAEFKIVGKFYNIFGELSCEFRAFLYCIYTFVKAFLLLRFYQHNILRLMISHIVIFAILLALFPNFECKCSRNKTFSKI